METRTFQTENKFKLFLTGSMLVLALSCAKKPDESSSSSGGGSSPAPAPVASKYLYVASGQCYSGNGFTTFTTTTASNVVFRLGLSTGSVVDGGVPIADYFAPPAASGDSPAGITDLDDNYFLILVESGSGRRIEKVEKKANGGRTTFSANATALSATLRAMERGPDGSIYVSKGTAIEKFNNLGQRQVIGASTPWVNAPGGSCGTSTTLISALNVLSNNKLVFAHAAATQNRFGIISAIGYNTLSDCLSAQTAPNTGSYPTASVYIGGGINQLLVAYGSSTNSLDLNSIYSYTINESTNAITGATRVLDATTATYFFGISAMAYDSDNNVLYVATSNSTSSTVQNYNIEKFSYDPTLKVLTRVGAPFYVSSNDSKCIVDMMVAK